MIKDKYINLFTDFGFKKIFGTEANKDLLIHFLNTVLENEISPITDIKYLKNEILGKISKDRISIFDIYALTESGEHIIVELQRIKQDYFKDRSIYYASNALQTQAIKGKNWDYKLPPVYTVAIMDFVFENSYPDKVISVVKLLDTQTNEVFYNKLTFVYLEMPKFIKQENELDTFLDKWCYFFRNLHKFLNKPIELQEKIFLKLFEVSELANYTPKEYMKYEESLKEYRDWYATAQTLKREGHEEGLKQGIEQKSFESVKNFILQTDFSDEKIAIIINVPLEFVQKIRENLKKQ